MSQQKMDAFPFNAYQTASFCWDTLFLFSWYTCMSRLGLMRKYDNCAEDKYVCDIRMHLHRMVFMILDIITETMWLMLNQIYWSIRYEIQDNNTCFCIIRYIWHYIIINLHMTYRQTHKYTLQELFTVHSIQWH